MGPDITVCIRVASNWWKPSCFSFLSVLVIAVSYHTEYWFLFGRQVWLRILTNMIKENICKISIWNKIILTGRANVNGKISKVLVCGKIIMLTFFKDNDYFKVLLWILLMHPVFYYTYRHTQCKTPAKASHLFVLFHGSSRKAGFINMSYFFLTTHC